MQISEVRMQNIDFVFGFRLTCKQNHLRFSQVVFHSSRCRQTARELFILHSELCILHSIISVFRVE